MCVLQNCVKTETVAPQNDRATDWNVNFLLTATVMYSITSKPIYSCICDCHIHTCMSNSGRDFSARINGWTTDNFRSNFSLCNLSCIWSDNMTGHES